MKCETVSRQRKVTERVYETIVFDSRGKLDWDEDDIEDIKYHFFSGKLEIDVPNHLTVNDLRKEVIKEINKDGKVYDTDEVDDGKFMVYYHKDLGDWEDWDV